MSSKRPVVLMAILLVLLGAKFAWPLVEERLLPQGPPVASRQAPPAPVNVPANAISAVSVTRAPDGRWMATVDYDYTGTPAGAMIRVFQVVVGERSNIDWQVGGRSAQPGRHRFITEVFNPSVHEMFTTEKVFAQLDIPPAPPLAKLAIDHRIQWPDPIAVEVDQAVAGGKFDAIVQKAVELIDSGDINSINRSRALLQTLLERRPNSDAAYVELARVAMKTNWSSTGLREAESLIGSALQIRPDSVNAKILLGYVYAHQRRFKEAELQFAQSAKADPPNLWLWANWGEALAMQGKEGPAIAKYREAVTRPPTGDTYDRARRDAYENLLRMLERRNDLAGMEALLKQRAQEYKAADCLAVEYAKFLALYRADAQSALGVLRDSPSPRCNADRTREVQGLAHYVAWSQAQGSERAETLRQARAFFPAGPGLFYALASSDRGMDVARLLTAAGEKVGLQDNSGLDALAYALRGGKTAVARRLLRLGANPLAEAGPEKMPAALIPVLTRDFDSIRLLQGAGVDYTKLRYQGATALEHARAQDDAKLLQLLDPRSGRL